MHTNKVRYAVVRAKFVFAAVLCLSAFAIPAHAAGALSVEIMNGYNLVVDSNVTSPSTYAPSAAYIGAKVCNTGDAPLSNVVVNTGNYNGGVSPTPGTFPVLNSTGFTTSPQITNTGNYSLTLESDGTQASFDGSRYVGTLAPGQCIVQYWLISYPQCVNVGGVNDAPPCAASIAGDVKPVDDVSLNYDVWATTTTAIAAPTVNQRRAFTLRNEISAAANKIWPNTSSKVPDAYLVAIQSLLGWGTLGPDGQPLSNTNPAYPGQRVITTEGIWYDLGNVGQGFDNNGDLIPDQNAWLQPVGDAASFDADCFRLVNVYGLLVVKLKTGGEQLIPFQNQLYFEHIPDNTGVVGLVYYQYIPTDGGCSAVMTPYQEAASGFDNEKFSADFGLSNGLSSGNFGTLLAFDKTAPTSANQGSQLTYTLTAPNNTGANLGAPDYGVPLTFTETVPAGTSFVAGSAGTTLTAPSGTGSYIQGHTDIDGNLDQCTINYNITSSSYVIRYSNNNGATWTTTEPAGVTNIQWLLFTSMQLDGYHDGNACVAPNGSYDNGTLQTSLPAGKTAAVAFRVTLNAGPYVCNTGVLGFGGATSSTRDTACTIVNGTNSISGFVFEDTATGSLYGNGTKDTGENGIGTVTVWLYYDANGNGALDAGDVLLEAKTAQTSGTGAYTFSSLPDGRFLIAVNKSDTDGTATSVAEVRAGWGNTTSDPGLALTTDQGALKMNETPAVVTMAVNIDLDGSDANPASVSNVNFGFAPPLRLTKAVTNNPDANANGIADTTYDEGDSFSYSILAENRLPSVGHQGPIGCQYTVWAPTGANGSPAVKEFVNPQYAWDGPNRTVASVLVTGGGLNYMDGTGFTVPVRPGNIIKVEGLYFGYFGALLTDDTLTLKITQGVNSNTRTLSTGMIDSYSFEPPTLSPDSAIPWDVTSLKPGGGTWSWADNFSTVRLEINPSKASSADQKSFYLDAIGVRITTDQSCASSSSTTLSPVPLQDDYDQTRVDFVSATPPPTSVDTVNGIIKWDDIGPIEAGASELVTVNVRARNVSGATNVAPNTATTQFDGKNVLYADGRLATNGTSSMSVNIQGKGELRGTIWSDRNQSGWAMPTDGSEPGVPNVTVTLWGCMRSTGVLETTSNNKTCAATTNGNTWAVIGTTTSNATGAYEFIGLDQGFYLIEVGNTDNAPGTGNSAPFGGAQRAEPSDTQQTTLVSGNTFTANGTPGVCASCNNTWGDPNANTNALQALNSPNGEEIINGINFGYYFANAVIYGNIYWDIDGDAVFAPEPGETGLSGFTVRLYNSSNALVATTTTNSNGDYSFGSLGTGTYSIRVTPPILPTTAWAETYETTGGTTNLNNEITVSVTAGDISGSHRFGYTQRSSGSIGDTLYFDFDEDGVQDATEGGIPNVTVYLYSDLDRDGTIDAGVDEIIGTTATDASGRYLFSQLGAGSYVVRVDTTDPDFPDNVTATGDPDIAAASIGDTIFYDNNGNGTQDSGDDGIPFVIVNLYYDTDSSNTLNGADTLVASTSTNVDGKYLFTGLSAGRYFVDVDDPSLPSTDLALTTTDPATVPINLAGSTSATTYLNADAGYSPAANFAIGNRVWHDVDNDGVQDPGEPGIPFVDVVVTGGTACPSGCRVSTTAEGFWIKTGLTNATYSVSVDTTDADFPRFFIVTTGTTNPRNATVAGADLMNVDFGFRYNPSNGTSPTASITGRMYLDLDGDLAFDVGEARAGRTVNLMDQNGHIIASATTAADGTYAFNGIFIGDYSVQGIDPLGTRYSVIFVAAAQTFANLNIIYNNSTETVADSMSSVSLDGVYPNLLQDFGYKRYLGSIGDSIFWDVNENGTQDLGEPGFAGVTVRLYEVTWTDTNGDGMFQANEASNQTLVATTTTISDNPATPANEGGTYIFANLDEATTGKHYLVVPDTSTLPNANAAPPNTVTYTLISDPDTDGTPCTALPNPDVVDDEFPPLSVCDSQKLVIGFQFGNNYLGADFGYRAVGNGYATIGDHLWIDIDADGTLDSGEARIDAVTVWLDANNNGALNWTDGNGNGVWDSGEGERWTQTDPDGYYVFTNVADGTYELKVLTSDPDWPAGLPTTPTFEVRSGNTASRDNAVQVVVTSGAVSSIVDGDNATTDSCSSCNLNVDFGYRYAGANALSGTVCIDDATKNGYCGANATTYSGVDTANSEVAIGGVVVSAYAWTDGNSSGTAWSGGGTLEGTDSFVFLGSTSTNSLGDYTFANLPDNVILVFSVSDTQNLRLTTTNANSSVEDANVLRRQFYDGTVLYQGNTVTVVGRQALSIGGDTDDIIRDADFAFESLITYDFGDLPSTYGNTLLANSGAQHRVTNATIYLGGGVSTETDGRESALANQDSQDNGVVLQSTEFPDGGAAYVDVTASAAGWLVAWIDFNGDGDFDDPEEMILDQAVNAGVNNLSFYTSPAITGTMNDFFARFRIYPSRPQFVSSTGPGLDSNFQVMSGEVEDHMFTVDITPTQVEMMSTEAKQGKSHVTISWKTSSETDNLGFHVYRQVSGGEKERLNAHIITGSAFMTGRKAENPRSYRFIDKKPAAGFVQYWIEDIDLNGEKTLHGPITPAGSTNDDAGAVTTDPDPTLGSVGGIFTTAAGMGVTIPAPPAPTTAQRDEQWALASVPAVKVVVTQPGWYRVTKGDLVAAGFDPGTNANAISVFTEGTEVPVLVNAKNAAKFDTTDSIEFFGRGIDVPGTGGRVYYITAKKGTGLRVKTTGGRGNSGLPAPASFPYTFERIERTLFFAALTNNGDRENFFGPVITTWPATQSLTVANHSMSGTAQLEVVLQGGTDNLEHVVAIALNGSNVGYARFPDQERHVAKLNVPASLLVAGANTVTFTSMNGWEDVSVLESVRLTYPHAFRADNDALAFTVDAGTAVNVGGFTTDRIRVLDVTDPFKPDFIDAQIGTASDGTKAVQFATSGNGARTIFAFAENRVLAPAQVAWNEPSTWNATSNGANLVIVTNKAFKTAANALKTARDAQGISTVVVDVQNLYDEFSYGHHSAQAIRDFFQRTGSWKTKPRYAILFGDASYDPRNYLGLGSYDFVPTKMIKTAWLTTSSDDWFADFGGTGLPSIAIGRLPVRTAEQATAVVNKLVARGNGSSDAWAKSVDVIADADVGYPFNRAADQIAAAVPSGYTVDRISVATTPNPSSAIVNAFNSGSLLTTYIGHGSVEIWSFDVFSTWTAMSLNNGNKTPFVVALNCLNGYFHDLWSYSLAEALLNNADGGAIGVWASSALSGTTGQVQMNLQFNRSVFTPNVTIGDAVLAAKQATRDPDIRRTWILFGDPSMKLK